MKIIKYIAIGAVAATVMGAAFAYAQTSGTGTPTSATHSMPMVLQISPAGKVLMRGTVNSVSSNSLTIKTWGGDWTVNVSSLAKVMPNTDLSQVKAGDFVGIMGKINAGANFTVDATLVRDWSEKAAENQQAQQNRQAVTSAKARVFVGTASNVSANSLTLTTATGATYTVTIAADAKILNQKWLTLLAANIKSGDTMRVYGVNANSTIAATVVRDISIK